MSTSKQLAAIFMITVTVIVAMIVYAIFATDDCVTKTESVTSQDKGGKTVTVRECS